MSITLNNEDTGKFHPQPGEPMLEILLHWCEWYLLWEPRKAGHAKAHNRFSEIVREVREASNTETVPKKVGPRLDAQSRSVACDGETGAA